MLGGYKYPELWRGCVGAWASSQGATGFTLIDHSPNRNHGTLTNMDPATDWVASGGKYALDFEGTNDHIAYGTATPQRLVLSGRFSLSCWVYLRSVTGSPVAVANAINAGTFAQNYLLFVPTGGANPWAFQVRSAATDNRVTGNAAPLNVWHHIAATYLPTGASDPVLRIFQDGLQTGEDASGVNAGIESGQRLTIGSYFGTGNYLNGLIDDVRVYDRTLAQQEIRQLATRRSIAYERAERRVYSIPAAPPTGRKRRQLLHAM
jgi:hypothetical protein